jgi:hypothetical protein
VEKAITILAVAAVTCLAGCVESTFSESFEFDGPIDRVVVAVDTGDISLRAGGDQGGLVEVEVSCRTAVPPVDVYMDGTTLHVAMDAGHGASACEAGFTLSVPGLADADLRTGSGDVTVEAFGGDVEALTYDGGIDITDLSGSLDLTAASGDVRAAGLTGSDCTITVGAGRVEASFDAVPALVDVEVTSGNAALNVPSSTYLVEAEADDGQVEVSGLVEQPSAASEIWVAVTTGDINITGE